MDPDRYRGEGNGFAVIKLKKWQWWAVGVGAVVVVGGVASAFGAGGSGSPDISPTMAAAASAAPSSTAGAVAASVPDVTGAKGDDARKTLTDAGFVVKFDAGKSTVLVASNWVVDSQDPAAGTASSKGAEVTLKVSKPAPTAAAKQEAPAKLTKVGAQTACSMYTENQFPYGVKLHWITGTLADQQTKDGWFLKVLATVTNGFGAKQKNVNVECHITGTDDAPVMAEWLAY